MTETSCWIEFKTDKALQKRVSKGEFSDSEGGCALPILSFPMHPNHMFWTGVLRDWCQSRNINWREIDGTTVAAKVKRDQIRDFVEFVYADAPIYNDPEQMFIWKGKAYMAHGLADLRAFVAQELNPRLWYELMADTY